MPTPDTAPKFVLVKSTNPHREGQYGRMGLRFSRAWRVLEVDDVDDRDVPAVPASKDGTVAAIPEISKMALRNERGQENLISTYTLAVLDVDSYLAVKPATASDVEKLQAEQAEHGGDKDALIEQLRVKNADLEARMMRLEQASSKNKPADKGDGK